MRVLLTHPPYQSLTQWPSHWVTHADSPSSPNVIAFRCRFVLDETTLIRLHVTADERYDLWLDGKRIGRGSERGDANNWFFETYDLVLEPGSHCLVTRVWSLGVQAPYAQMSVHPGLLISPDQIEHVPILGTGCASWEAKRLGGYEFINPMAAWGTGENTVIHGDDFSWDWEFGNGDAWKPVQILEAGCDRDHANDYGPTHLLAPATLPPMRDELWNQSIVRHISNINTLETHSIAIQATNHLCDEQSDWDALMIGTKALCIPAYTRRRILVDLTDYACIYPELVVSEGLGSQIRLHWQESLFDDAKAQSKGNRDQIENKFFVTIWWETDGIGDTFLPDGGHHRRFDTLWWQCGRYLEIVIETQEQPLVIEKLSLYETRYPLEMTSRFQSSDARLEAIVPIALRTLQMCAHETYFDCPYYEQLMYIGDTRLQALTTYVVIQDARLPRKAIHLFDESRLTSGLTQSRYPSRVTQITRGFSLWWIAMVHDFAYWRNDTAFVLDRLPGIRAVLDGFRRLRNCDGFIAMPAGPNLNFVDWVPEWKDGVPPGGQAGINSVVNLQYALVLKLAAELEDAFGDGEMAVRARRHALEIEALVQETFWDEDRGLFADDLEKQNFSEHAQCLAILNGGLQTTQLERIGHGLLNATDLARTTIYFSHYLFETYYHLKRTDALLERLELWFGLKQQGLKTTIEMPEPTRSDCHAWGAHPLYHYYASILGIRPDSFGFGAIKIAPQLGPLTHAKGTMVHPHGIIEVEFYREGNQISGLITLPDGLHGAFCSDERTISLVPGKQRV